MASGDSHRSAIAVTDKQVAAHIRCGNRLAIELQPQQQNKQHTLQLLPGLIISCSDALNWKQRESYAIRNHHNTSMLGRSAHC